MSASFQFKIWQKGPKTNFSHTEPYSMGFEFTQPIRLDTIRCILHQMSRSPERGHHLEIWENAAWKKIPSRMVKLPSYPAFMFPSIYHHHFAPVVAERIRIVYQQKRYFYCFKIEALFQNQVVASAVPVEEPPEFQWWRNIMRDTIESYSKKDRPGQFAGYQKNLQRLYLDRQDRIAGEILRKGEPTLADTDAYFPGIRFGSTVIGFPGEPQNNLRVEWNQALLGELLRRKKEPDSDPTVFFRKRIGFLVGKDLTAYGQNRDQFSEIQLLNGHLPYVTSTYLHAGIEYRIELFTHRVANTGTVTSVRLGMKNRSSRKATAVFGLKIDKFLPQKKLPACQLKASRQIWEGGQEIAVASVPLEQDGHRFFFRTTLPSGQQTAFTFLIRPSVYSNGPERLPAHITISTFEKYRMEFLAYWKNILSRAVKLNAPETILNNWYYASLVLLLLEYDRKNGYLYYGTGCTYDHSLYVEESLHAPFTLAFLGLETEGKRSSEGLYTNPWFMKGSNPYFQVKPFRYWASYFAYMTYLYTHDKVWLRVRIKQLLPRMDALLREIRSSGKGILPAGYFGGDIHDRKVFAIVSDLQACFGIYAFGRALEVLGDRRAGRYLAFEKTYRVRILKLMEQTRVKTTWGKEIYALILKPYASGYIGKKMEPVFDNIFGGYLHIFFKWVLFTGFFKRHPEQRERIVNFMEEGGSQFGGLMRLWGFQAGNTYHYGYRRELLERGKKDQFLQCLYADVRVNCNRHFQGSEHYIIIPDPDWGLVEEKQRLGISDLMVTNIRSLCDMFYLEEFDNVDPTGKVRIGAGIPDRWFKGGKPFSVQKARLVDGQFDLKFWPLKDRQVTIELRSQGFETPKDFVIRIPMPKGQKPRKIDGSLAVKKMAREVQVSADSSFRIIFTY